jgi:hypothetical protein
MLGYSGVKDRVLHGKIGHIIIGRMRKLITGEFN